MIAAERRRVILDWATQHHSVNATELSRLLDVGISTIRRDLDALHQEGRLLRVHGGALVKESAQPRTPYRHSRDKHMAEKALIAQAALAYLPEAGTIFISGGTTAYQLAALLPADRELSVITNGLDAAAHIAGNRIAPVDLLGGSIRPDSLQSNCEENVDTLYWDVTFLGLAAIDLERGITTDSRTTASMERAVLRHGSKFVALCDSSKIGRFAYAQVGGASTIDVFITDDKADPEFLRHLREEGVEVVVARGPEHAHPTTGEHAAISEDRKRSKR